MTGQGVAPLFELTRGRIVESTHYGAAAVVDATGRLLSFLGDPNAVTFLRSSAKPFQAMPFFEAGGPDFFGLTPEEQALLCASHEGSDDHVKTALSIQTKAGFSEADLQCGVHMPGDASAYRNLIARGEAPSPNRNNCSGKHSGMLAYARMRGWPLETYLEPGHPLQQEILTVLAEMSRYPRQNVEIGIDGCSAPNFALPLYNAALAFARLCDPRDLEEGRREAARRITSAMTGHPRMISGAQEFDCRLMQEGNGRIVCKRGAEGYQAIGVMPGALAPDSPGIGIAFKVSDGDLPFRSLDLEPHNRVRPAVALEILRQMGALEAGQLAHLKAFGPELPIENHRHIIVGTARPVFDLASAR